MVELGRQVELLQQRCAELYDEAPVAYVTLDEQGVARDINLPGAALLGVERHYAVGLPFRIFVAQQDRRKLQLHLARYAEEGSSVSQLSINTRRAGGVAVELRSRRTVEAPELCFTAVINISAQVRAEAEQRRLHEAEVEARDVNSAKDQFIASLSHELRSPLAPVLVALPTLEAGRLPPLEEARLFAIVRRNVLLEARLIDDLLDVTRIASGKFDIRRQTIDLNQIVLDVADSFADEVAVRRLTLVRGMEAPLHHVDGDPIRLHQVFANLIKNAIKFTPAGGQIAVRSWNRDDAVIVEVSDTGEGIEEAALGRIFNRFEQAGRGSARGGGLGLGLTISKGIVELHGGRLVAHSVGRGHGARFQVELASVAPPIEPAVAGEERLPPRVAARARGARILLVEDEADLAETLMLLLEAEGFEVQTAATAGAALDSDLDGVSIIITDLGLPDLNGRDMLAQLKATREVRAIALSGYGTEADIRASHEAGFLRHLTKPVEMGELLGAIDFALQS
jgi:PAS domain S-box-containing protein